MRSFRELAERLIDPYFLHVRRRVRKGLVAGVQDWLGFQLRPTSAGWSQSKSLNETGCDSDHAPMVVNFLAQIHTVPARSAFFADGNDLSVRIPACPVLTKRGLWRCPLVSHRIIRSDSR